MALEDFDWKGLVRKVAPTVATALGGPLAGVATSAISQILLGREDGSPGEISTAISSGQLTGEQIVALKQLETEFKQKENEMRVSFADLEYKTDVAYLADVQSARQRQVDLKDNMPQIITAVTFAVYVLEFIYFATGQMNNLDEFTKAIITRAFGTVDGILLTCVAFFMGTSKGSKNATAALTRIAEAPIPAPVVVNTPPPVDPDKDNGKAKPDQG